MRSCVNIITLRFMFMVIALHIHIFVDRYGDWNNLVFVCSFGMGMGGGGYGNIFVSFQEPPTRWSSITPAISQIAPPSPETHVQAMECICFFFWVGIFVSDAHWIPGCVLCLLLYNMVYYATHSKYCGCVSSGTVEVYVDICPEEEYGWRGYTASIHIHAAANHQRRLAAVSRCDT
jgi:hypothetical protein